MKNNPILLFITLLTVLALAPVEAKAASLPQTLSLSGQQDDTSSNLWVQISQLNVEVAADTTATVTFDPLSIPAPETTSGTIDTVTTLNEAPALPDMEAALPTVPLYSVDSASQLSTESAPLYSALMDGAIEAMETQTLGGDLSLSTISFNVPGSGYHTPEPTTMLLLGTGLVGIAGTLRKRKKQ